ncbi:MAG TPA: tRNA (adenosine(37)-N6)-threonylcarbamoyltransferase complex dimerization subunit type 1 TsaB [Bauldia sp.]|nr:tRNA (adenosine(37)-N6)-threonylcarbamoyltransferase complex dimerization subunit type 1 TsaB [Bauldia sp.]
MCYPRSMRLLAIDTALEACSVGVIDGERIVVRSANVGRGHAEILMGQVDEAMREAGLAFADLDRIAVTVGPGSFTGLRVGIAAARGFALAAGKPAVGIGTLAIHAAAVAGKPVLATLTAGRGEIYGQFFAADGSEAAPARAASPEVFAAEMGPDTLLAGSGADLVIAALPMDVRHAVIHRHASPDIATLCRLALAASETSTPPKPLYLRLPDAKPQTGARIAHR